MESDDDFFLISPKNHLHLKPEIKYAAIAFIAFNIWLFAQFFLGFHTNLLIIGLNSELANLLIVSLALWFTLAEKSKDFKSSFTVRKSFRTSFLTGILIVFLTAPVQFIYDYYVNPLWVEKFVTFHHEYNPSSWWFELYNPTPNYPAELLSNTETHLCLHIIFIIAVSFITGFVYKIFHQRS